MSYLPSIGSYSDSMRDQKWAELHKIEMCTGVSRRKLARWCNSGRLPASRESERGAWWVDLVACVQSTDHEVSEIGLVTLAYRSQIESAHSDYSGVTVVIKCIP